jgi:hypothetical protein
MEQRRMAKRLVARPTRSGEATTFTSPRRKNRPGSIKPPKVSEASLHRAVAELLDWVLAPPTLFTTFPAGWGKLPKRTGKQLKNSGLKKGMPDILIFYNNPANRPHCIGIELKPRGRAQSSDQRSTSAQLQAVGVKTYVCHDTDEVLMALGLADVPRRDVRERGLLPLGLQPEPPTLRFSSSKELDDFIVADQKPRYLSNDI